MTRETAENAKQTLEFVLTGYWKVNRLDGNQSTAITAEMFFPLRPASLIVLRGFYSVRLIAFFKEEKVVKSGAVIKMSTST